MKKQILFIFIFIISSSLISYSQTIFERLPLDHIWLLADNNDMRMDFNHSPPLITMEDRPFNFDFTNASICDEDGELLFYTNGVRIANRHHQYLENGYRINPGPVTNAWAHTGNRSVQGALVLQQPNSDSIFHVIYAEYENIETENGVFRNRVTRLHHGIIHMSSNNQLGTVIEKDFPLIIDTLDAGKITACKHGNGNDWWIVIPYRNTNKYHRFLLTNNELLDYGDSFVESDMKPGLGQATFSPDGKKYVNYSLHQFQDNYLAIYDFDRCTGLLSNPIIIQNDTLSYVSGVSISENGRFLYESLQTVIYQIDLHSEDIVASRTKVAQFDGYYEGNNPNLLWVTFFLHQLAPNGKIYINSMTSTKHLHTIEEPNKRGTASRVEQHNVMLPTQNQFTLPNYPYYGLGPWDGSPCDTLNINNPVPVAAFEYTVDPDSTSALTVEFYDASKFISQYDPTGVWHWDFGDDAVSDPQYVTAQHPVYTYADPGIYEVCLTVTNVTGSDTFCDSLYLGVTSLQENFTAASLRLSPNPFKDQFSFVLNDYYPKRGELRIVDGLGRSIHQQRIFQGWNTVDGSAWVSGVYFWEFWDDGFLLTKGKVVGVD